MRILKVRMGEEERQILVDVFKSHKRPSAYTLTVKVVEHKYGFHDCRECIYNEYDKNCCEMCRLLEETGTITEFVREEFGVSLFNLTLIPIRKIMNL